MADRAKFSAPIDECVRPNLCYRDVWRVRCVETVVRREPCGPRCCGDSVVHDHLMSAQKYAKRQGARAAAWSQLQELDKCEAPHD